MRDNSLFLKGLEELGISLSETQLSQFEQFYDLLVEKNKVMNLTAITEYDDVIVKHFLDSLSIAKVGKAMKRLSDGCRVLDVGTGAGFPGIPLKIAFPNSEFVLMDSLNKRINFIHEVCGSLKLEKITAIHARCEEFGRNPLYREKFALVVSRAVARLNSLSELCIPFVSKGGEFIPYKSGNIDEELEEGKSAVSHLGGRIESVIKFNVPCSDIERSLIDIKKISNTSLQYPRAGGKIQSKPL